MLQNHSQCAWTQWGFISAICMTASSLKPTFHLNTNAGIVLTSQCRVLSLPLSAQPPHKFPSLLLWPHIPKLSLAGNYMHFNAGNKQGLTNILLQWDLKSGLWMLSSPDDILSSAFSREVLKSCPLCKDTKRITEGCEIAINIGFQKLSQLKKEIQFISTFSIGWG